MKIILPLIQRILITFKAVDDVLYDLFGSGYGVISRDVKQILAHPKDRLIYLDAINDLKTKDIDEVDVHLSGNKKMKLTYIYRRLGDTVRQRLQV